MSTQAQAATVRQEITVGSPVERAFRVFTGWPLYLQRYTDLLTG